MAVVPSEVYDTRIHSPEAGVSIHVSPECYVGLIDQCDWCRTRDERLIAFSRVLGPRKIRRGPLEFLLDWPDIWLQRISDTALEATINTNQDADPQGPCQEIPPFNDGSTADPGLGSLHEDDPSCSPPLTHQGKSCGAEQDAAMPLIPDTLPVQGAIQDAQTSGSDSPCCGTRSAMLPDNDGCVALGGHTSTQASNSPLPRKGPERRLESTREQRKTWDVAGIDGILATLSQQSEWGATNIIDGRRITAVGTFLQPSDPSPPSTPTALEDVPRRDLIQVACMLRASRDEALRDREVAEKRAHEDSCNRHEARLTFEKEIDSYQQKWDEERSREQKLETEVEKLEDELRKLDARYQVVRKARDRANRKLFMSYGDIWVMARIRDRNNGQQQALPGITPLNDSTSRLVRRRVGSPDETVEFYRVFSAAVSNADIFKEISPMMEAAFGGTNVCVIADGQSAMGKSYTMFDGDQNISWRMTFEIIAWRTETLRQGGQCRVGVSAVEVYKNNVRVLLEGEAERSVTRGSQAPRSPDHDRSSDVAVSSRQDLVDLIHEAKRSRAVNSTDMNAASSRSHFICTITLSHTHAVTKAAETSQLLLVDLAGNEQPSAEQGRQSNSQRTEECKEINRDREALRNVVAGLHEGRPHIPYRNRQVGQSCSFSA